MLNVTNVRRPTYGKRISSLKTILTTTTTTQCLFMMSSMIRLRLSFLPINPNKCGGMTRLGTIELAYVLLVHLFVCFVRVSFCNFSLPLGVGGWLRFLIVAFPGPFY